MPSSDSVNMCLITLYFECIVYRNSAWSMNHGKIRIFNTWPVKNN